MNSSDLNLFSSKKRIVSCKSCSETFESYLEDKLHLFLCKSCTRINNEKDNSYSERTDNKLHSADFKLGDIGEFEGKKFKIVGITSKRNLRNATDKWTEYSIVDSQGKVSFLNRSYGSYTWIKDEIQLDKKIDFSSKVPESITYEGREYRFFIQYKLHQSYFVGELNYDVQKERTSQFADFTCPPYVLSVELNSNNEQTAFHGNHIPRKKVAKIFNKPEILQEKREGYGMGMPFMYGLNTKRFAIVNLVLFAIMLVFNVFYESSCGYNQVVFDTYEYNDGTVGDTKNEFVSESFTITDDIPNYMLEGNVYMGALDNQWAEFVFSLVNESTGEEREFTAALERWSGVDNGYSWEEGSIETPLHLSSVKPGKYHLRTKVYASPSILQSNFTVLLNRSHSASWNFYFLAFTLIGISIILFFFHRSFERVRTGQIDTLFG
ncbi:MAG: DUF4178 domain-containing protein [Fluviicola sp.]|jgi:hypothetical protein